MQLSVIIPHYNHGDFIGPAVQCILDQTFTDFELMVIDDGSTDGSDEVVRALGKKDPRIRLIMQKENRGIIETINKGVREAQGEFVHCYGCDDLRFPRFLERSMEVFEQHPELALTFTQFYWGYDGEKPELEGHGMPSDLGVELFDQKKVIEQLWKGVMNISGHTSVFRRDVALKMGVYDPSLFHYCDWFLSYQIVANYPTALIKEPLVHARVGRDNFSNTVRYNKRLRQKVYRNILRKLQEKKHRQERALFKKSGLLDFIFKEFFWRLLINPRYVTYWPYINRRFPIRDKISRSLRKVGFFGRRPPLQSHSEADHSQKRA